MSSEVRAITVLWAVTPRYDTPHVVRAWSHSLEAAGYGLEDEIEEAKQWMDSWGDESGWTYWTTIEHIPIPPPPTPDEEPV